MPFSEERDELSLAAINILVTGTLAGIWVYVVVQTARLWSRYVRYRNQYHRTWAYAALVGSVIVSEPLPLPKGHQRWATM